jgi:hypothetical protein
VSGARISVICAMHKQVKMADIIDRHTKQRVVIDSLTAKEVITIKMYRHLNCDNAVIEFVRTET